MTLDEFTDVLVQQEVEALSRDEVRAFLTAEGIDIDDLHKRMHERFAEIRANEQHPATDPTAADRCACCGMIYGCYCHEYPHDDPACPGR